MSDNMARMNKLLLEVGNDVNRLEGDALSEYLFNVKEVYWQEFSKVVANALSTVPESSRAEFLYTLQDSSSVFGSNYSEYMTLKIKEQVLDETLILDDSDKALLENLFALLSQSLLSFADVCFTLRTCDLEVLFFEGHTNTFRLVKIIETSEKMTRGRTEEYKIKGM